MRQTKYRGQHINTKEWVYGNGVVIIGDDYAAIPDTRNVTSESYEIKLIKVIPETVGQYTSFTDKNDNEIYEDDIVRVKSPLRKDGEKRMKVVFENGCYRTPFGDSNYRLGGWDKSCIEVIGNIHSNPELLNQ